MARISLKSTIVAILCVSFVELSKCADDKCVQQNQCLCKFADDQTIDLNKVSNADINGTQVVNATYHFFGCANGKVEHKNATGNCDSTSLCLYNATDNTLTNLGKSNEFKFVVAERNPHTYDLSYKNDSSRVELVCSPDLSETKLIAGVSSAGQHQLILLSKDVCKGIPAHGGLSTGSTLLMLFLIGMLIYFIGGAVVLYFLRGARGTEMIPNVDFWKDLPNLVKDGLIFLLNGCRPTAIATAETYDRI